MEQPESLIPNQPLSAQSVPPTPVPAPVAQPATPLSKFNHPRFLPIFLVGGVLFIILIIFVSVRQFMPSQNVAQAPTPTPSPIPTPTPIRELSVIASQSAFADLQQSVASLSGAVSAYRTNDPSLSPPVLTLPLGFSN